MISKVAWRDHFLKHFFPEDVLLIKRMACWLTGRLVDQRDVLLINEKSY